MARLATAKKSATSNRTSADSEIGCQPRTKPARAARVTKVTRTGDRLSEVAPVLNDCEESSLESEFMLAMQAYKKSSGRMFPTWSEVLEVLQSLGYRKTDQESTAGTPGSASS
ncbi:hypothetical protein V5E97_19715 [Singulisphaera sp. Ch08]|uniref:Uncharacterized protein n=1 Tax=Singulisphaera sp. Ch08 TaxID=3120278 RepID=A0AAU7CSK3_9BACT